MCHEAPRGACPWHTAETMNAPHQPSGPTERARALFRSRFLREAETQEASAEVEDKLGGKLEKIEHGDSDWMRRMRDVATQATDLWARRGSLNRKQLLYLTAGLLYFISPIDAVSDVIPILGYIDDAVLLSWILSELIPAAGRAKDKFIDEATDTLVEKGQVALDEVVDRRSDELLDRLDRAADETIGKYVTGVVIGLWGTTTAAAVSLALTIIGGGYSREWAIYVGVTTALVIAWNAAVALSFVRQYRQLDSHWRERLPAIVGVRVMRWRHMLAVALPVLAFIGLAAAHFWQL